MIERLLANMSNVTSQNVLETRTLAELLSSRQNATVVVEALLSVILNIAALFLNCVLCWAANKNHRLRRIISVYVLVLALTDLLTAGLVMPFMCDVSIYGEWRYSWSACQFQAFCCVVLAYIAQLMFPLTAINRYVRVLRPRIYSKLFVRKYTLLSIIIVSLCAIIAPLPYLLRGHTFTFHPGMMICFYAIENSKEKQSIYRIVFFTILPMVIVAFCYFRIYNSVKKHSKMVHSVRTDLRRNTNDSIAMDTKVHCLDNVPDIAVTSVSGNKLSLDDILMTKTLFTIIFAFFVCWTPLYIITAIDTANGAFDLPRQAYFFATYLVGLSSIINPLIFGYMNATFREECKMLIKALGLKKPLQVKAVDN